MTAPTNPQNSISVCHSRPLRARRDASIANTAPTLPAQIAPIKRSKPGRAVPPPDRPRSSSMISTLAHPSCCARSESAYWRRLLSAVILVIAGLQDCERRCDLGEQGFEQLRELCSLHFRQVDSWSLLFEQSGMSVFDSQIAAPHDRLSPLSSRTGEN